MPKPPVPRLSEADPDFLRLSLCYLEGELSAEGVEAFQAQLRADSAKREAFVRLCLTGSALFEALSEGTASGLNPEGDKTKLDAQKEWPRSHDLNETMVLPVLTGDENESDEIEGVFPPTPVATPPPEPVPMHRRRWFRAASVMIPLLVGLVIYALTARRRSVVTVAPVPRQLASTEPAIIAPPPSFATVASTVDAQWSGDIAQFQSGQPLPARALFLQSGFAEIKFDTGATMIVEAPARFQVRVANSVELTSGQISAKVPAAAHGFAVETATTRIVDFGTEFGVAISPDGSDQIQVFKGIVQAQPQTPGSITPLMLSEGQAAVSTGQDIKLDPAGAQPQEFVRSLTPPSSIDMVDLICGGDGTMHLRSGAIDQRTGESGQLPSRAGAGAVPSDYHNVPKLQVVNGCFVPNGKDIVDSRKDIFDFGVTSARTLYEIRAGGTFPWPTAGETFTAVLSGVDYSQPNHGLILLHPNAGITFDLAAIRRIHPGVQLAHFRAVVGNTCPNPTRGTKAHAFVLVDGVSRSDLPELTQSNGGVNLDVSLADADRFLTITIADDRKTVARNWIILGDPRLE